jgi:hypothetical protein
VYVSPSLRLDPLSSMAMLRPNRNRNLGIATSFSVHRRNRQPQ